MYPVVILPLYPTPPPYYYYHPPTFSTPNHSILQSPLLHILHPPLQLPDPAPDSSPYLLAIASLHRGLVCCFQFLEFGARGGAVVGGVDGFFERFFRGDVELLGRGGC